MAVEDDSAAPDSGHSGRKAWVFPGIGIIADVGGLIALANSGWWMVIVAAALLAIATGSSMIWTDWGRPTRLWTVAIVGIISRSETGFWVP